MKCLVAGGAGFIGSHIVDRLILGRETLADNTKAKENINWSPKVSLIDGIEKLKKLYSN